MIERLNEIFSTDFNLNSILSLHQHRDYESRFKNMNKPRILCGLFYLADCSATYYIDGSEPLYALQGDVIFLPEGSCYTVEFHIKKGKFANPYLINFHLTSSDGKPVSFNIPPARLCSDNGKLLSKFTAAVQLYKSAAHILLKSKVYEILGCIFPLKKDDELSIDYIHRHFTEQLYVSDLARRSLLSESEYRLRFKEKTGMSPIRYITKLKIDAASKMLIDADIPISVICDFLNICSVPYFYKIFKDETGLTPNEYRDKTRI